MFLSFACFFVFHRNIIRLITAKGNQNTIAYISPLLKNLSKNFPLTPDQLLYLLSSCSMFMLNFYKIVFLSIVTNKKLLKICRNILQRLKNHGKISRSGMLFVYNIKYVNMKNISMKYHDIVILQLSILILPGAYKDWDRRYRKKLFVPSCPNKTRGHCYF